VRLAVLPLTMVGSKRMSLSNTNIRIDGAAVV